jgi:uncharacterized protein YkwD
MFIAIGFGLFYLAEHKYFEKWDELNQKQDTPELPILKSEQTKKELLPLLKGDLFSVMGMKADNLTEEFGDPTRIDPSPYGYMTWVYTDGETNYIQFGVKDNEVQTIFATGKDVSLEPFSIGASFDSVKEQFPIEQKVTYRDGISFYTFILQDDDMQMHPLIQIADDLFVQCFIDTFTNEVSSIRIVSGDVLLDQRMYEMEYRGTLPEKKELSDAEWEKVEQGMEQQIFELTNVYRSRFGVASLQEDNQVSEVAFLHSKDMFDHNYFSHYSKDGKGLKERLAEKDVYYLSAGENIAAQYTDAPAAMEGWLNSEGHREALLYEDYTHLGVGVYHLYYTQNFLLRP